MQKKMRYFLFAGLLLFFASTTVVWAESCAVDDPKCCEALDIGKYDWQFRLIGPTLVDPADYEDQCRNLGDECYQYKYNLTPSDLSAPLSQVLFTIPSKYEEVLINGAYQYYQAGIGDQTTGFGTYVQEIRVAEIPPTSGEYIFYSNVGSISPITGALKSGKDFGSCKIAGPDPYGYDPNEVFTVSSERTIKTSDNKKFHLLEDDTTECIVYGSYEQYLPGDPEYDPLLSEEQNRRLLIRESLDEVLQSNLGNTPIEFVGDTNQRCKRAIAKSRGEQTWYFISGRWLWR